MNNYELISFLVEEIIKRLNIKNKIALIIFTGTEIYTNKIYEYVKDLKKEYSLKVFLSHSFEKSFDLNYIKNALDIDEVFLNSKIDNVNNLLNDVDSIIIPSLSINTLAKVSLGIRDSNVSDVCASAILKDIPITVLKEGCEASNISLNINVNYKNMIYKNIDVLKTFGVNFVSINKNIVSDAPLKEEAKESIINTNVLTRSQILECIKNGHNTILVSKKTKITLLAKDSAKELGVEIKCI